MLIGEANFRDLIGEHIIIKNKCIARYSAKMYEVIKIMEEKGDFDGKLDDIEANEDANALLAIPYIDHATGLSFGILEVLHIDKNNHFDIIKRNSVVEEVGMTNRTRREDVKAEEFIYLEESANPNDLDLEKYSKEKNTYINNYTDDNLRFLRSIKELDPFRDENFPDDIMTIFMIPKDDENENTIMEGMLVRVEEYKDGLFYGKLLNNPNDERFNLERGDEVRFIYDSNPTPVCLAIPMEDK